jgi:DNA-directed RNA polymerase subunit alpha
MDLIKRGFQLPKKISFEDETLSDFYGKLIVEPLERGFGTTLGNSLRRVLLSSIEGSAVYGIRIPGVLHEFSSIKGIKEDVVDLILNIKKLRFLMYGDGKKTVRINVKGPKEVTASDIETDSSLVVLNRDNYIAYVNDKATFEMEMYVKKGKGYVLAEVNKEEEDMPVDAIAIDSSFSPIRKVNFWVEGARVGRSTNYDRLIMEIFTDGSITPEKAISDASSIIMEHINLFVLVKEEMRSEEVVGQRSQFKSESTFNENLLKSIDELELSVRAYNCLKNANIKTLADLVQKTEHEMLRTKNFGRKSLDEIKEILASMGLHFGMRIDINELAKHKI